MITRLPKGAAKGIVLLHGRGGSARDIMGLLDHAGLAGIAAAAPEAMGQSWWPTSFLAPQAQMAPHLARGLAAVDGAIAALESAGLERAQIWLAGFSQGACLALEAFARNGAGLAGVFGFSGGLVGQGDSGAAMTELYGHADKDLAYPARLTGKGWISVHEHDPHIPLKRAKDSVAALQRMGADMRLQVYPGAGHGMLAPDLAALRAALG